MKQVETASTVCRSSKKGEGVKKERRNNEPGGKLDMRYIRMRKMPKTDRMIKKDIGEKDQMFINTQIVMSQGKVCAFGREKACPVLLTRPPWVNENCGKCSCMQRNK